MKKKDRNETNDCNSRLTCSEYIMQTNEKETIKMPFSAALKNAFGKP